MSRQLLNRWNLNSDGQKAASAACAVAAVVCLSCVLVHWPAQYPDAETVTNARAVTGLDAVETSHRALKGSASQTAISPTNDGANEWPHVPRIRPAAHEQAGAIPVSSFLARFSEPAAKLRVETAEDPALPNAAISKAVWLSGCIEVGEDTGLKPASEHL